MRLLYIILFILIVSCSTSKLNVGRGTFQTVKPPNIYGNDRYLANDTNYIISFDASIGKNKTIPLPGKMNNKVQVDRVYNHIYYMPEMPADINYRLIENTLGVQFHKAIKDYKDYYAGFGVGVQNQPYVFAMLGHNGKFFEIGGAGFWGLTINKASYEGWWYYYEPDFGPSFAKPVAKLNCNKDNLCCDDSPNGICYDYSHQETIIDNLEYIKLNKVNIFHSYAGFVAHASFYWEKFALSYAASMTNPWLVDELPVSEAHDADISFWFPVLLMQDIGISYTPNKIKYRLGINQITGIKSPGQYWGFSVQMAYMW